MSKRYPTLRDEDTEQQIVIEWSKWAAGQHPELRLLHHIPNGGSRNEVEAAKLKRIGVLAGVSDLHLPVPKGCYCGLYIEMKNANGRLRTSQKEFLTAAASYGNYCCVCYSAEDAVKVISDYLKLNSTRSEMLTPNLSTIRKGKVKLL